MDGNTEKEEIFVAAARLELQVLTPENAQHIVSRVSSVFELGIPGCWWWQSLCKVDQRVPYGGQDGLAILEDMLQFHGNGYIVFTGDESPPWTVIQGSFAKLMTLVRELPFIEFFLVDSEIKWVVFDTHHNELIVSQRK